MSEVLKIRMTCDCGECGEENGLDPCWVYEEFEDGAIALKVEARS
jgi:hypothetical protein